MSRPAPTADELATGDSADAAHPANEHPAASGDAGTDAHAPANVRDAHVATNDRTGADADAPANVHDEHAAMNDRAAADAHAPANMHAETSEPAAAPSADEAWMDVALREADRASSLGEVPVGCVLVGLDGAILAAAHNQREMLQDPTAHAEMVAIRAAAEKLGSWRLEGVTCFVTLEPCAMCAGALVHARVARVVYGCDDPKGGAVATLFTIGADPRLNHRFTLVRGVRSFECASRLRTFFAALRALGKK